MHPAAPVSAQHAPAEAAYGRDYQIQASAVKHRMKHRMLGCLRAVHRLVA